MRLVSRLATALAALSLASACATDGKKPVEASMTISEEPNTPPPAATSAAPAVALQKLAPPEGFEVMIPGEPKEQRKNVPTKAGDVVTAAWSSSVDNVLYSVSLADYPQKLVTNRQPASFLEEAKTGLITQLKGTLKSEEAIELNGHPGKAFVVTSDAGEVKARNYFVGNRLYTLIVIYNPAIGAPMGEQFLGSLQLVDAAAGQPAAQPADAQPTASGK